MLEAAEAAPNVAQYWINVVILDISLQDAAQAQKDLQAVEALNKLGHLSSVISGLRNQIADIKSAPETPPGK